MPQRRLPEKDFVWNPNLAYAVGLLVTDGCLSSNNRTVVLVSKDREILENFKTCLNIENRICDHVSGIGNHYLKIQYGNVQFYDWLLRVGLFQAKSYTIGEIAVPDEFFRDYFRGCIDGDGNIQTYRDEYNTYKGRRYQTQRLFIKIVSASEAHILWLQNKIETLAGVRGFITYAKPRLENYAPLWGLKFAKKKSIRLIEWMYYSNDIPCLGRKRVIAEKAVEIIAQQERRKYTAIKE
jgi:hypothetical protein